MSGREGERVGLSQLSTNSVSWRCRLPLVAKYAPRIFSIGLRGPVTLVLPLLVFESTRDWPGRVLQHDDPCKQDGRHSLPDLDWGLHLPFRPCL